MFVHILAERPKRSLIIESMHDRQGEFDEAIDLLRGDMIQQRLLVRMVPEECRIMDARSGADLANGDLLEGLLLEQPQ